MADRNIYWKRIGDNFHHFCLNLRVDQEVVSIVSDTQKQITKQLNLDFYGSKSNSEHSSFLGSYGRGTAVGVEDVDMLYILPPEIYPQFLHSNINGPLLLREKIKNSIQKIYPSAYLGNDGLVVRMDFEHGISFEIFPAFENVNGSYKYPDSTLNGSWNNKNPNPETEIILKANKELCRNNLTKLCRMMKVWKSTWNIAISGFLIDTLAYDFLTNWNRRECYYSYYDSMILDFFDFLQQQDPTQQYWQAPGSGEKVFRNAPFEEKAAICHSIAKEAIQIESDNHSAAIKKWREIFGDKFPS